MLLVHEEALFKVLLDKMPRCGARCILKFYSLEEGWHSLKMLECSERIQKRPGTFVDHLRSIGMSTGGGGIV